MITTATKGTHEGHPYKLSLNKLVPITPLIVLRIGFGVLMLASTLRFMAKGWIHAFYVVPRFHFTYPGFGWVTPLSESGLWAVFIGMALCSTCIALGLFYRPSMITFCLLFTYIELLDKSYYLNHYYFVSVFSFILIFLPLNGAFSLDTKLGFSPRKSHVPAWMLWTVRLQIAIVYFYAGLAKINPDWLLRAQPLTIWLRARTAVWGIGWLFDYRGVAFVMSWSGMLFDLTIPVWLMWRPSQKISYGVVVVFHTLTAVLFNIGMFPWVMITVTLVFFDWNWGEGVNQRRGERGGQEPWLRRKAFGATSYAQRQQIGQKTEMIAKGCTEPAETSHVTRLAAPAPFTPTHAWQTKLVLGALLISQLLLPLRHFAYPGNVNWNEQGFRFAWRVMLVEKTGEVVYTVTNPETEQSWIELPGDYLTVIQAKQMVFQPDMIVQFARFLDEQAAADLQVTAEVNVSWNGRSSQPLIDPTIDLTTLSFWNTDHIIDPTQ